MSTTHNLEKSSEEEILVTQDNIDECNICLKPSRRSQYGLDWFNFFLSDVLNGVDSFLTAYLTGEGWGPQRIGFALSASSFTTMLSQIPVGALVDIVRHKQALIAAGVIIVPITALIFALWPLFWPVVVGQIMLGIVEPLFCPAISAISLGLVGQQCLGTRIGRNQAFGAAGNVVSAVAMGLLGYYVSTRSIFFFVMGVSVPTLIALSCIRRKEINYERSRAAGRGETGMTVVGFRQLFLQIARDRRLLIFFSCVILFHFGNASMLPIMVQMLARDRSPGVSSAFMSACVVVTQFVSALLAAWVGRGADIWGRKPFLLVGWAVVPLRGFVCILTHNPILLVAVEILDGIAAAIYAVVIVLVVADLAHGTGRFNLLLGALSVSSGIGYTLSNSITGTIVEHYGFNYGFMSLSIFGTAGFILLCLAMPETLNHENAL
jgi:MFS family permease